MSGKKGRTSSFEVTASMDAGTGSVGAPSLLHSKLSSKDFPEKNQLITKLTSWASTGKA